MAASAVKIIQVTNNSGFFVKFKVLLDDVNNLNHNFQVVDIRELTTVEEMRIFYTSFNQRNWSLNEFIFIATNNNLCVSIFDNLQNFLVSYGSCRAVVIPPNIVSADYSIFLPASTATLIATVTQGTYTIASTLWTQVSGPNPATIASPNSTTTNVSGLVGGTYVFNISADDGHGNIVNAIARIVVSTSTASIQVFYGAFTTDPYTALQTADSLTYQVPISVNSTDPFIRVDFTFSEGTEEWYVVKVPLAVSPKTNWYSNALNYGTLPDSVWRQPFVANGYRYYVTRSLVDNPGLPYIFS
jgi:hypothetical protein